MLGYGVDKAGVGVWSGQGRWLEWTGQVVGVDREGNWSGQGRWGRKLTGRREERQRRVTSILESTR